MEDVVTVASLHKHRRTTLERIEKYISDTYFSDVNLRGRLYPHCKRVDSLSHWCVPGGEGKWEEWTFEHIVAQDFKPTKVGESFGPLWSTHWFKLEVTVPQEWTGQQVWLRWKSQSEAMIWSHNGQPLQGLSTGIGHQMRSEFPISKCWNGSSEPLVYFIEMACNNMFGAGKDGMINPPDEGKTFTLEAAEICTKDKDVYKLLVDLEVLYGLAKNLQDDIRGFEALYAGNQIINYIIKKELEKASGVADMFFSKTTGSLAHTLALIGHCHIDSAWLWPYSETKRKCARSWLSTLQLFEEYPEMRFACSQAQQFEWVKVHYPAVYERIKTQVKTGRFIPVGGTWVEMDGLIPSGESFMRQFLYGQLFFQQEFGILCKEFWLPDTFGYSAQIPQICKHFGVDYFLTQKLSWSLVNKFPHHNFIWEGIDGSTVLAHFPPGDSYEMNVTPEEGIRTIKNLEDKGRVRTSAFLYGYGDGGGGPTRNMLERARRMKDVDGCPKMKHMSPQDFFQRLESEKHNLCRWVGELFLELHNGTYTSQAKTKQQNRRCEFLLRETELLLVVAALEGHMKKLEIQKHQDHLTEAWKKILLNQFHDVLPGSSIGIVYRDSDQLYSEAQTCASEVKESSLHSIFQGGAAEADNEEQMVVVNSFPWNVHQILTIEDEREEPSRKRQRVEGEMVQTCVTGGYYVAVDAPGIGWSLLTPYSPAPVTLGLAKNGYVLENAYIRAVISSLNGQVTSLSLRSNPEMDAFEGRDGCYRSGNQIMIYDDIPLFWDAWDTMDYHLETPIVMNGDDCSSVNMTVVEEGPLVVKLRWELKLSDVSSMTQEIELTAVNPYLTFNTVVDWHENRKFLKVAFDSCLKSRVASYDTQFGHLQRPTDTNTSWESAKYEVCGHKWADISEYNFGISVLNDSKYGWAARGGCLTLSLLRSPKAPDEECDMGSHSFRYALMPHKGSFQSAGVPQRAYEFNSRLITSFSKLSESRSHDVWYDVDGDGTVIEAVKLAEDKTGDVILRLCEIFGGSPKAMLKIRAAPKPKSVHLCSGLEEKQEELAIIAGSALSQKNSKFCGVELSFSPFKIINVRISYE